MVWICSKKRYWIHCKEHAGDGAAGGKEKESSEDSGTE